MRSFLIPLVLFSIASFGQDWKTANDLGMDHYQAGDYAKAEAYFRQAMEISLATTGATSNEFITSVTNLGYSEQKQSNYAKAQEHFRLALRHTTRDDGSIHINQIEAIINLANAFLPAARYDSCEYYLLEARQLVGLAVSKKTKDYIEKIHGYFEASVSIQNSLASLYFKKGLTADAIAIMARQRIDIRQAYPDDYRFLSMYKSTLNNLSNYYMAANNMTMAKNVVKEQVSIVGGDGERSIDYLYALNNLASMYRLLEQPDSAEYVWKQSLVMIDSTRYHGSDLHISILNNLGEMYSDSEAYEEGRQYLTESLSLQEMRPVINPRIYQTTLLNLCETDFWNGDLAKADGNYRKLSKMLLEEILHNFTYLSDREKISFYRSNLSVLESYTYFAFEASGAFRTSPAVNAYVSAEAMKDLFNILLTTKGLILHPGYRLKTAILASDNPEIKTAYEQWEGDKNEYASLAKSENADVNRLSFLKQRTEALEKWLRIHSPEFRKGFVLEQKTWMDIQKALSPSEAAVELVRLADGLVYGALILTSETTDGPVLALVKSTQSKHLDQQYYRQYANSVSFRLTDTTSYAVYWEPILRTIRKHEKTGSPIQRIYFSPDGIYNRINPSTLYNTTTKRYLIDELDIRHVTNLKEILSREDTRSTDAHVAVIAGRPLYNTGAKTQDATIADLAGTEKEVDDIDELLTSNGWTTTLLKHVDATEAAIKRVQSPTLLHLATHGFSAHQTRQGGDLVDILLNSGVLLAGAGDTTLLEGEDGQLTAYEMMNINLDSTRLVVLSACETGLGEFHTGEGIYGLQAALRSAGARSVIMSLWKVDDIATQRLMTRFYTYWIKHPGNMRLAFQQAQRDLRAEFPEPYFWGAFVLSGD